ncbi:IPT/TIG domain-containing protein [Allosalinactinospora lopnorensis]|uniref:IPT/TIG domain-containing protein n=1 Tax=Allosalinactinospora lopnorensis TaxID=1352348 RepID=UPI000623CA6F|nr:IPT/TIG domain-containing protein [Allosalinactinospora lopnorensis]
MPLTPSTGPSAGGTAVAITGSNLANATTVHFGTKPATITNNTATQVDVISPAGHGAAPVNVTTPSGTSNALPYFYIEPPIKSGASPLTGSEAGGDTVTISGSNLSNATSVTFGANAGTITANTAGSITVTAPAGTGTVPITVTTPGGTTNGFSFSYVAAPTLASVDPASGSESGGTQVTITGTSLTHTNEVTFDGAPASFVVLSDTSVSAVTPAGTGTVDVDVTTTGGTGTLTAAYAYTAAPGI